MICFVIMDCVLVEVINFIVIGLQFYNFVSFTYMIKQYFS